MVQSPDLADALTAAAAEINRPATTTETLEAIVRVARDSMNDIDHAGVTLSHRNGELETAAASDSFVLDLDRVQYEFHEGPCVTALEDDAHPLTIVEHARHESRWHRFIPAAVRLGLTAQLGVRLFVNDKTAGVLNLYSTSSETIGDQTRHLAELFATHAALAYGHSRQVNDLRGAIETRQLIGQGIGIVMERYDLDADRAFEYLVRVSSRSEMKLRDVAADLVTGRQRHGMPPS